MPNAPPTKKEKLDMELPSETLVDNKLVDNKENKPMLCNLCKATVIYSDLTWGHFITTLRNIHERF